MLIRLALRHAAEAGHWTGSEAEVFPRHRAGYKPRKRWLWLPQAEAELGELQPHHAGSAWRCSRGGAPRGSQRTGLEARQERSALGLVEIWGTKTEAADRVIPMSDELRTLLFYEGERPTGPVVERWDQAGRDLKRACQSIEERL